MHNIMARSEIRRRPIYTGDQMKHRATHSFTQDDFENIDVIIAALRELVSIYITCDCLNFHACSSGHEAVESS